MQGYVAGAWGGVVVGSLRDMTGGTALTNRHLSASVTQWQMKRSEIWLSHAVASDRIDKPWLSLYALCIFILIMHKLYMSYAIYEHL